jgi:GxxExxY protein
MELERRKEIGVEGISAVVVDCAFRLHVETGPGLLESVYEVILVRMLEGKGFAVARQVPVPIELDGMKFDEGFKVDIVVEDKFLIELKSVEALAPVHGKQLLTYLRLRKLPLGLLINFGAATFKEGVRRVANHHVETAGSKLDLHGGK